MDFKVGDTIKTYYLKSKRSYLADVIAIADDDQERPHLIQYRYDGSRWWANLNRDDVPLIPELAAASSDDASETEELDEVSLFRLWEKDVLDPVASRLNVQSIC